MTWAGADSPSASDAIALGFAWAALRVQKVAVARNVKTASGPRVGAKAGLG